MANISIHILINVFHLDICTLSPAPVGLFSRPRLRGTQGGRLYTAAQGWVPGELRSACSGVQRREIWQVIAGTLSTELAPSKTVENPQVRCFALTSRARTTPTRFKLFPFLHRRTLLCMWGHWLCVCVLYMFYVCAVCGPSWCICVLEPHISASGCCFSLLLAAAAVCNMSSVSRRPSSSQALNLSTLSRHGTTTVTHQILPFTTATDGVSVCACVCVLCFLRKKKKKKHSKRGGRTLRMGARRYKPTHTSSGF